MTCVNVQPDTPHFNFTGVFRDGTSSFYHPGYIEVHPNPNSHQKIVPQMVSNEYTNEFNKYFTNYINSLEKKVLKLGTYIAKTRIEVRNTYSSS